MRRPVVRSELYILILKSSAAAAVLVCALLTVAGHSARGLGRKVGGENRTEHA
jgi:hypothetical protein